MNITVAGKHRLFLGVATIAIGSTGLACVVCNIVIVACCLRSKRLVNKCYILLLNLAMADALVGGTFVGTMGRWFSCLVMQWSSCFASQPICVAEVFPLYLSSDCSMMLSFALACDRLMCVKAVQWYQGASRGLWWRGCAIIWIITVLIDMPMFLGLDYKINARCSVHSVTHRYYQFSTTFGVFVTIATVATYVLSVVLGRQVKVSRNAVPDLKRISFILLYFVLRSQAREAADAVTYKSAFLMLRQRICLS